MNELNTNIKMKKKKNLNNYEFSEWPGVFVGYNICNGA